MNILVLSGFGSAKYNLLLMFIVMVFAMVLLPLSDSIAQNAPSVEKNNWVVKCATNPSEGKKQCQMSQTLTAEKTGQHILTVIIRSSDAGKKKSLLLALPHGLYLPAGIVFQVDNRKARSAPIQTSDGKGVYMVLPITTAFFNTMKAGNNLKISMQSVKRETITLAISLSGFTRATKDMISNN